MKTIRKTTKKKIFEVIDGNHCVKNRIQTLIRLGFIVRWEWVKFGGVGTIQERPRKGYTIMQIASSGIAGKYERLAPCIIFN